VAGWGSIWNRFTDKGVKMSLEDNSWVTMAEANIYFGERIGADKYWVTGTNKEQALITAYRQLINTDGYSFPDAPRIDIK